MFQPGWSFRSGFCMVCNGAYDMFSHNPLCVIPTFFLDWPSDEIHVCFPIDEKIALAREVSKTDLKLCGGRMLSDGGGVLAWLIHVRWTHFSISPCSQSPRDPGDPSSLLVGPHAGPRTPAKIRVGAAFATNPQATLQDGLQGGLVYVEVPCLNARTTSHLGCVLGGSLGPSPPVVTPCENSNKNEQESGPLRGKPSGSENPQQRSHLKCRKSLLFELYWVLSFGELESFSNMTMPSRKLDLADISSAASSARSLTPRSTGVVCV
mmetsp:Transcript_31668/g.97872  ORF Transcript_31668/g.97872 Transcript_31668/m.97872 type:complete len:265 (-) Transcript_31668:2590-3384(-)